MDEDKHNGFVNGKKSASVCNNLFSSGLLDRERSPMSELTMSLQLSKVKEARRRLSLQSDDGDPSPIGQTGTTTGVNSPLLECPDVDSPFIEHIRSRRNSDLRRKFQARSFSSPMMVRKPLAPLTLFNNNSPSPFASPRKFPNMEHLEEKHSDLSICEMADKFPDLTEEYKIKRPRFHRRSSAPTLSLKMEVEETRSGESLEDEGFFGDELLQSGDKNMAAPDCPTTLLGLIAAPMINRVESVTTEADKENLPPTCNGNTMNTHVFQKPIGLPFKKRSLSCSIKRDSPSAGNSPRRFGVKKQKCGRSYSFYDGDPALRPIKPICPIETKEKSPRVLQRSQSFDLKPRTVDVTLFDMDDKSLIGDKSKKCLLPTIPSKHADLKGISPDTLSDLINGAYKDDVMEYIIVDCRYPYEFDGGHIKGGLNIYDRQGMIEHFLKNVRPSTQEKRRIVIFHCEFSSKRGPNMCRFLRNKDRDIHQYEYPKLYYPELYLLEGGYKEFYEKKKELCEPQGYREMVDSAFNQELRLFKKRSKSWSEDNLRSRTNSLRY